MLASMKNRINKKNAHGRPNRLNMHAQTRRITVVLAALHRRICIAADAREGAAEPHQYTRCICFGQLGPRGAVSQQARATHRPLLGLLAVERDAALRRDRGVGVVPMAPAKQPRRRLLHAVGPSIGRTVGRAPWLGRPPGTPSAGAGGAAAPACLRPKRQDAAAQGGPPGRRLRGALSRRARGCSGKRLRWSLAIAARLKE